MPVGMGFVGSPPHLKRATKPLSGHALNNITGFTDSRGRLTAYAYSPTGNLITETDPLLQTRHWTYNTHGQPVTQTDWRGNTTTFGYDTGGNLNSVTAPAPLAYNTTMTFDAVGNLLTVRDPLLHDTTHEYNARDQRTKTIDPTGAFSRTVYDAEGSVIQTIDENNHTTAYLRDHRKRITRITNPLGGTVNMAFDANDDLTGLTDENGNTTTFAYNIRRHLTDTTDAEGNIRRFVHDPAGNLTSEIDENNHPVVYAYDPINRITAMTDALGNTWHYEYNGGGVVGCAACGATPGSSLLTKEMDAAGKVTYFKYNELDELIGVVRKEGDTADVVDASDALTNYAYDSNGNVTSTTEPNGNTATAVFDVLNRLTSATNAAGDVTTFAYDGVSNVVSTTAPNGNVTSYAYTVRDELVQVDDSIGRVANYTYDAGGRVLTDADGNGNTTQYAYDVRDLLTGVTDALGHTATTQFDAAGNVLQIIDRNGNATHATYDRRNFRLTSRNALGDTTQYLYDPAGNLTRITDANGRPTLTQFDNVNRVIAETYADAPPNTVTYTYNAVGNVISRTNQRAETTTYTYDDFHRLTQRSYPVSPADHFTYDLSGRMLTADRGGWLVTFAYDGGDRVKQTTQNGQPVGYAYNIPARTRTVVYGGITVLETYDTRGRLRSFNENDAFVSAWGFGYDTANNLTVSSDSLGIFPMYAYDADNRISSIDAGFFTSYGYDNEGNRKLEDRNYPAASSKAYLYDPANRLIDIKIGQLVGATIPSPTSATAYALNAVGNWNSTTTLGGTQTRVHNAANELTQIGATPLTYDDNGNLQQDGTFTYAYDEENRLTRVTRTATSAVVGQYQYDAFGRRVRKIAHPAGVATETRYLYDGTRLVAELDAGATTQATYLYGGGMDEMRVMHRGLQSYDFHHDALGSAVLLVDTGAPSYETYTYDAYGLPRVLDTNDNPVPNNAWGTAHSALGNPLLFTGQYFDEETGLYHYRARYLDPAKGRFLTRDPIGIWADLDNLGNGYAYVASNPARFTDPSGLTNNDFKNIDIIIKKMGHIFADDGGGNLDGARTSTVSTSKSNVKNNLLVIGGAGGTPKPTGPPVNFPAPPHDPNPKPQFVVTANIKSVSNIKALVRGGAGDGGDTARRGVLPPAL